MKTFTAFLSGLIFAAGLAISGMTQPSKVIGFLDFTGDWDPSLMFVMLGAIAVHSVAYRLIRLRRGPIFDRDFRVPDEKKISKGVVIGSLIFGVGWGLSGYCPGPAVASLATLAIRPMVFVASMLAGMLLFRRLKVHLKNWPTTLR